MVRGYTLRDVSTSFQNYHLRNVINRLTWILSVREQRQIRPFHNRHNRRQERRAHHSAQSNLRGLWHLESPKSGHGHDGKYKIRQRRVRTEPVREVVKNIRVPAFAGERLLP